VLNTTCNGIYEEGLAPWIANPYSLVSWWGMEKFVTHIYYRISRYLCNIKNIALVSTGKNPPLALDEDAKNQTLKMFKGIGSLCNKVGMTLSSKSANKTVTRLEAGQLRTHDDLLKSIEELDVRIVDEMEDRLFFYVPPTRAERYNKINSFGEPVSKNFVSAAFDIKESGNCYATGRFTACVFHAMRALEVALLAFSSVFSIQTDRANWQNVIEQIENKIRELGKAPKSHIEKEKFEFYSQAASSFMFFKDAWRNYTAHSRGKYTEEEADAIYRNVSSFMKRLAEGGISEPL
jgi:hypothetical protein